VNWLGFKAGLKRYLKVIQKKIRNKKSETRNQKHEIRNIKSER
jgi:hypothetical protein